MQFENLAKVLAGSGCKVSFDLSDKGVPYADFYGIHLPESWMYAEIRKERADEVFHILFHEFQHIRHSRGMLKAGNVEIVEAFYGEGKGKHKANRQYMEDVINAVVDCRDDQLGFNRYKGAPSVYSRAYAETIEKIKEVLMMEGELSPERKLAVASRLIILDHKRRTYEKRGLFAEAESLFEMVPDVTKIVQSEFVRSRVDEAVAFTKKAVTEALARKENPVEKRAIEIADYIWEQLEIAEQAEGPSPQGQPGGAPGSSGEGESEEGQGGQPGENQGEEEAQGEEKQQEEGETEGEEEEAQGEEEEGGGEEREKDAAPSEESEEGEEGEKGAPQDSKKGFSYNRDEHNDFGTEGLHKLVQIAQEGFEIHVAEELASVLKRVFDTGRTYDEAVNLNPNNLWAVEVDPGIIMETQIIEKKNEDWVVALIVDNSCSMGGARIKTVQNICKDIDEAVKFVNADEDRNHELIVTIFEGDWVTSGERPTRISKRVGASNPIRSGRWQYYEGRADEVLRNAYVIKTGETEGDKWINHLNASGGTCPVTGVEALKAQLKVSPLDNRKMLVILLTDGEIDESMYRATQEAREGLPGEHHFMFIEVQTRCRKWGNYHIKNMKELPDVIEEIIGTALAG